MSTSVIHGEWIGKHVRIIDATNPALVGLEGLVVDETKHLFVLDTKDGEKRIQKNAAIFELEWDGAVVRVPGTDMVAAPQERIKRKVKQ